MLAQNRAALGGQRRRVKLRLRDDLACLVGADPFEVDAGVVGSLKKFQPEIHALIRAQRNLSAHLRVRSGQQSRNDQAVVDPQRRAVVRRDVEGVKPVVARLDLAGPADGKIVYAQPAEAGRTRGPVEVHRGIHATRLRAGKISRRVVIPRETRARCSDGQRGKNRRQNQERFLHKLDDGRGVTATSLDCFDCVIPTEEQRRMMAEAGET